MRDGKTNSASEPVSRSSSLITSLIGPGSLASLKGNMKTLKIQKVEICAEDENLVSVHFACPYNTYPEDFDLGQLGDVSQIGESTCGMVMVSGAVVLKAGDSITDEFGGQPIIGSIRTEAVKKNFAIKKSADYRDVFEAKFTGKI